MPSQLHEVLPYITVKNLNDVSDDVQLIEYRKRFHSILKDLSVNSIIFYKYFTISENMTNELKRRGFTVTTNHNAGISEVKCGCTAHGEFCRGCCKWTEISR